MSGVFLSHSSADKNFISKLAVDLAVRGIPVWFDSWEMETGDRLYDRIFEGIDESTLLVLALSPDSIKSRWVDKELSAGLVKEDRLNRKVIIPIKISACEAPLAIADRIYADFTNGYLRGLETLVRVLMRQAPDLQTINPDSQILPLVFYKGLYLERVNSQKIYGKLVPTIKKGREIGAAQIICLRDEKIRNNARCSS